MSNKTLFIIIGAIALLVVGLFVFAGTGGDETPAGGGNGEGSAVTGPVSDNTYGNPESKVVLMEAYSLACGACGSFHPVLKEIRQEYEDHVLFQVVHYTLSGTSRSGGLQNAKAAHRAVEAAGRQDKFWEMHDILFENQSLWTAQTTSNPIPQIKVFAEEIGLDLERFDEDFADPEINDIITGDESYLRGLGVDSTPTFFINGEKLEKNSLLASVDVARSTLDNALREAERAEEKAAAGSAPSSNHVIGSDAQGVLVLEAYSLACPACAAHQPLLKQIHEEYGSMIQFQVLHYPLGENFANAGAGHRAAEAAARQGKFWEMHDILFERQDSWRNMAAAAFEQQLETYAAEIGLDVGRFRTDYADPEVAAIVAGDERYLDENFEIAGTPTFFINGEPLSAGRFASIESARQILDEALGQSVDGQEG